MTAAAKTILESFDELPEREKREVASAMLRRTLRFDLPLYASALLHPIATIERESCCRMVSTIGCTCGSSRL